MRPAGGSGLLGTGGEDHGGGEAVHAQSRDVDLVAAVGGELQRDKRGKVLSVCVLL